ncbi:MAG: effector-associated domain EAD1-containing protein [Myxococcota bacterium]
MEDTLLALRQALAQNYPTGEQVRPLLELAGLDVELLTLEATGEALWREIFDECTVQGEETLESLIVELQERHPQLRDLDTLLQRLSRGELQAPQAAEGGGSLTEAVVRDPLEGSELLLAFAEARGSESLLVLQLQRYRQILLEIAEERRVHGRTLVREARWKQALRGILELAHELEAGG